MTEQAGYQVDVEKSKYPNIFAADYSGLSPEEIVQIIAERIACAITMFDELTADDKEVFERERAKRYIFNEMIKRTFGSGKILDELTGIPPFILFLYGQNQLTAVEENVFRERVNPILQEEGINFPE